MSEAGPGKCTWLVSRKQALSCLHLVDANTSILQSDKTLPMSPTLFSGSKRSGPQESDSICKKLNIITVHQVTESPNTSQLKQQKYQKELSSKYGSNNRSHLI